MWILHFIYPEHTGIYLNNRWFRLTFQRAKLILQEDVLFFPLWFAFLLHCCLFAKRFTYQFEKYCLREFFCFLDKNQLRCRAWLEDYGGSFLELGEGNGVKKGNWGWRRDKEGKSIFFAKARFRMYHGSNWGCVAVFLSPFWKHCDHFSNRLEIKS